MNWLRIGPSRVAIRLLLGLGAVFASLAVGAIARAQEAKYPNVWYRESVDSVDSSVSVTGILVAGETSQEPGPIATRSGLPEVFVNYGPVGFLSSSRIRDVAPQVDDRALNREKEQIMEYRGFFEGRRIRAVWVTDRVAGRPVSAPVSWPQKQKLRVVALPMISTYEDHGLPAALQEVLVRRTFRPSFQFTSFVRYRKCEPNAFFNSAVDTEGRVLWEFAYVTRHRTIDRCASGNRPPSTYKPLDDGADRRVYRLADGTALVANRKAVIRVRLNDGSTDAPATKVRRWSPEHVARIKQPFMEKYGALLADDSSYLDVNTLLLKHIAATFKKEASHGPAR